MYGILKNMSDSPVSLPDFGVTLQPTEELDLDELDDLHRLRLSLGIQVLLTSEDLMVYDLTETSVHATGLELWIQDQLNSRPRFEAYNTLDSDTFATNAAQPLDTTAIEAQHLTLSPEGTHIDVEFDGAVDIQAEVSFASVSGSGISGLETWIELNGVFVPGTLRGGILHAGEVCSMSMGRSSLMVAVNDEITIMSQRTSGSLGWKYPASGCRLRLRRVE